MHPLEKYIQEGENLQQDFKYFLNDAKKIARTLAAFANTAGGRLLIGVKDNGSIVGLKAQEEEARVIEAAAEMYCKPRVAYRSRLWKHQGKQVLEIRVDPGPKAPYRAPDENGRWKYWLRKQDENKAACDLEIAIMKLENRKRAQCFCMGQAEDRLLKILQTEGPLTYRELIDRAMIKKGEGLQALARLVVYEIVKLSDGQNNQAAVVSM